MSQATVLFIGIVVCIFGFFLLIAPLMCWARLASIETLLKKMIESGKGCATRPQAGSRAGSKQRCSACNYDLRGNRSGVCPECGLRFASKEREWEVTGVDPSSGKRSKALITAFTAAEAAEESGLTHITDAAPYS